MITLLLFYLTVSCAFSKTHSQSPFFLYSFLVSKGNNSKIVHSPSVKPRLKQEE